MVLSSILSATIFLAPLYVSFGYSVVVYIFVVVVALSGAAGLSLVVADGTEQCQLP